MTDGADVIDLFGRAPAAPLATAPPDPSRRPTRQCGHDQGQVDPGAKVLVCSDCGEVLDPYAYLQKLAETWAIHDRSREAAEREARLAKQRVDDLLLEERRVKARLRRMRAQERDLQRALERLDAELRAFTPDPQPDRRT